MAVKVQGSDMYTIDPDTGEVLDIGCVTSIDGIDTTIDQIETTCLNSAAREYVAGLATPGSATFGINVDPSNPVHVRLHQLKTAGTTLQWAIGWADGPQGLAPTVTTDSEGDYVFDFPAARSWIAFEGFMNSFPFTFALNAVVASTVGIQVSGEPQLIPKATS